MIDPDFDVDKWERESAADDARQKAMDEYLKRKYGTTNELTRDDDKLLSQRTVSNRHIFSKDFNIYKHISPSENLFSIKFVDGTNVNNIIDIPNLIVTNLNVQDSERIQVANGFNEWSHVGAFGRELRRANLSGVAFYNDNTFSGMSDLALYYQNKWRALKAAENSRLISITGPWAVGDKTNRTLTGIAISIRYSINSTTTNMIEFSIEFLEISNAVSTMVLKTSGTAVLTLK